MIKVQTITHQTCDVCGKEVEEFVTCGDNNPTVIAALVFNVYYDGTRQAIDLCGECNTMLVDWITNNTHIERNWSKK